MGFVLILGGARSGKSGLADRLGRESGGPVRFIATATPEDPEMEDRIRRHRDTRPPHWSTVEEPVDLQAAIRAGPVSDFVIVDCLTLWVSNLLGAGRGQDEIRAMAGEAALELALHRGVVVTNEVGLGIVPANELARTFRDLLGAVNALFADRAERSVLMVAGRALELSRLDTTTLSR
ncbi:MAG: bifunctional adenosylcobinamide kinase/adenosylcobinamide-phosphate guanylyltransferase [Chloroflexi bacterium]|nr:MAG: bifunctional adenosylcobinamide kinase/adenosylcobinamide-phosphate guanylyltransferase [Chloroflexota bacterium]